MPQGDKRRYTDKQKRKAAHIKEGYEARGVPEKEAQARAWATVNKDSGGGNLSGSGRGQPESHAAERRKRAARSAAARKGWDTRRKQTGD
ncbi:plasmid stabilization protein [Sphingobium rhizovicinum]|uniref:Plasmid stabilization protein n=1 Tax=Sphingobium rhizovicinum TaxID=432308 RepID=A0ABV7NHH3_9SPHN